MLFRSFTYWGATGDFNLGAAGRNAVDIYSVTLPAPAGQRHILTKAGPTRIVLKVARTEVELEDVPEALIAGILASDTFTIAYALRWAPETKREEVAELLDHLVRSGLLIAETRGRATERSPVSVIR